MTQYSVLVENVSKKFGLSLRSALKYGLVDSFRRATGRGKDDKLRRGEFWALKDINLALEPGDALGIMGVNGSGKTTLLRILNGTYTPDKGRVTMRGRIGALIAAGAGFSPMLSGRENVFISGTLLGMTPSEIRNRFDEIVDFSGLGEFIDMPVRNYSSGMSVRLGFAIAVLGSPEILLVDEVLAVGDIAFQKKCYERINTLKDNGVTILLVSHSPGAIWAVCNKGLVIHHGNDGKGIIPVEEACQLYDNFNLTTKAESQNNKKNVKDKDVVGGISSSYADMRCGTGDAFITSVRLFDKKGNCASYVEYGHGFLLRCYITIRNRIENGIIRISIDSEIYKAMAVLDNYESMHDTIGFNPGKYIVDIDVRSPNLRPGVYTLTASIIEKKYGVHLFLQHNIQTLTVTNSPEKFLYADFRSCMYIDTIYRIKEYNE